MIENDRLVSRMFASFGGTFGRRLTAAGLDTRDRMYHGASDTRPFYSKREFQFSTVQWSRKGASRASMPDRSTNSIGGFEMGFSYPRFWPGLLRLGMPQPVVDYTRC